MAVQLFGVRVSSRGVSYDKEDAKEDVRTFGTGLRAFDPFTQGGREARAEVRQTAAESDGAARAALNILGPPQARTTLGAIAETSLFALPALARPATRLARGAVRPLVNAVRPAARPAASAAPEVARAARTATTPATRTVPGTATAARQTTARVASTGAREAAQTAPRTSTLRGATRLLRTGGNPNAGLSTWRVATAAAGTYVGGAAILNAASRALPGLAPGGRLPAGERPAELADTPGYGGEGPTSPDYEGGLLSNLTAGLGSAFERVGDGIGDLVGSPEAGKAVLVVGTIAVLAWGLPKLAEAAGKTSGAFSGAKTAAAGAKGAAKAVRGPGGRFLKAVA